MCGLCFRHPVEDGHVDVSRGRQHDRVGQPDHPVLRPEHKHLRGCPEQGNGGYKTFKKLVEINLIFGATSWIVFMYISLGLEKNAHWMEKKLSFLLTPFLPSPLLLPSPIYPLPPFSFSHSSVIRLRKIS